MKLPLHLHGSPNGREFFHALNGVHELPVNFFIIWIPEVQTIGDTDGTGSYTGQVPAGLGNRYFSSGFRVEIGIKGIAVQSHGESEFFVFHPEDRCVSPRKEGRVYLDHMVILPENPLFVCERR